MSSTGRAAVHREVVRIRDGSVSSGAGTVAAEEPLKTDDPSLTLSPELLASLPDSLRKGQKVFSRTGCLHAAGPFDERGVLPDLQAPSSLACELAEESGMTLVGFLRGDSMNIYSGERRVLFCPVLTWVGQRRHGGQDVAPTDAQHRPG